MKCLNPLKKFFFHCLADDEGMGGQNVHLNQSCRKFDEMPKSTKNFFTVWPRGGCVHLNQSWGGGMGGEMFTWTKVCRKFDEMPKSTKIYFFHCLANGGGGCQNVHLNLKLTGNFLMKCLANGDGGWCQNVHLNQSCRKFDEMPKSTHKKFFSLFGWWWWGESKMFTWTKVAGNLMKCLNPLKKKKKIFSLFGQWGGGV